MKNSGTCLTASLCYGSFFTVSLFLTLYSGFWRPFCTSPGLGYDLDVSAVLGEGRVVAAVVLPRVEELVLEDRLAPI